MLTDTQINRIYNSIPTEYDVLSDKYNPSIRYANQWNWEDFPTIILDYSDHSLEPNPLMSGGYKKVLVNDSETFDYFSSKSIYSFEVNDVYKINEVSGVKDGSSYIFPDSSYYFNDVALGEEGDEYIEWVGETPDDGTEFTVDYDKNMLQFKKDKNYFDRLHINVYDDSSNPRLAREICREIESEFITMKFDDMVLTNLSSIESLSDLDTAKDHVFRYHFSVDINHAQTEYGEISPRIANIVYEVNTNGL